MTNKIYALVGPHACGKSTLLRQLISMGLNYIPTYTTRKPNKIDSDTTIYHFIDRDTFFKKDWIVKVTYKGEYYGVLKDDMLSALKTHRISVLLLDPNGIKQVSKLLSGNLETIYLMCDYVALVQRMLRLGHTNEDIKYHLEYAENNGEFNTWKTSHYVVKNTMSMKQTLNQVLAIMGLMTIAPKTSIEKL